MRSVSDRKMIREMDADELMCMYAELDAGNYTDKSPLLEECRKQYMQLTGNEIITDKP